jgi:tetratricopeptide (TPR) repeat protein
MLAAGKILLNRGNLSGALVIFEEAASLLSCKTNAGGAAHLQKAITLDSLGKNQEALKIYRQLRGHRCLEVAKMVRVDTKDVFACWD